MNSANSFVSDSNCSSEANQNLLLLHKNLQEITKYFPFIESNLSKHLQDEN